MSEIRRVDGSVHTYIHKSPDYKSLGGRAFYKHPKYYVSKLQIAQTMLMNLLNQLCSGISLPPDG